MGVRAGEFCMYLAEYRRFLILTRVTDLGWPERHAHRMNDLQWAYNDQLAELGNFAPLPKVYQDLYKFVWKRRTFDVLGYRRDNFEITGEDSFRFIAS